MARQFVLRNPGSDEGLIIELDGSVVSFKLMSDETDVSASVGGSTVLAALTENAGAIGGTNDGDLPDLSSPDAAGNAASVRELATRINEIQAALVATGVLGT